MNDSALRTPVQQADATGMTAIASVIVSIGLAAVGNGLMFAFIPLALGSAGYAPTWAGTILTMMSAGGVIGCLTTGLVVQRVGHARAFMIFSALIILSNGGGGGGRQSPLLDRRAYTLRLRHQRHVHRRPELA